MVKRDTNKYFELFIPRCHFWLRIEEYRKITKTQYKTGNKNNIIFSFEKHHQFGDRYN